MKKTLLSIFITALAAQPALAQDGEKRAVMKGQNSVNLYYAPNLSKGIWKAIFQEETGVEVGGLGPAGLVYEHMVTDGIGIGAEFSYTSLFISFDEEYMNDAGMLQDYETQINVATIRAMIRANFHFTKSPNFDAYFLLSAGYKHRTFEIEYEYPNASGSWSWPNFIPFGIKPGLGLRYFFSGPIGINFEIAAGTPVMCGGLSLRF